jgi:hypothetical protein
MLACVAVLALSLVCCGSSGRTLMTLGDQSMTVNTYELLLSRMKGTLEYSGYPTDEDAFWDQIVSTKGATYDDFFCDSIQNEAKKILVQLYLFEQVYDLTLPQARYDAVDQLMSDILELSFDGSKSSMNSYLSSFGVNIDMLRENYITEEKIDHLKTYIGSITSDAAKEEYYNENYVCFRQILLPLYEYCYETDENGEMIYYREDSDRIYYDTTGGATRTGTDGKLVVDENGDTVYYTEDGRIAYNSEKGVPHGKDEDNDGYVDYKAFNDEKKQIVIDRANALDELIADGDFTTFEEYGALWSKDDVWDTYPNGIFINLNKNYEINYLDDIQAKLADMNVGDTALVQSENAYHFIMKYELSKQGYSNKENADWFDTFEDEVATDILDGVCERYIDQIIVNDEVLKQAKTMKTVGSNMEY